MMRLGLIAFATCLLLSGSAYAQGYAPGPNARPDDKITPGVTRPLTLDVVCNTKWGKDHRAVTEAMKMQAFKNYGFTGNDDPRCIPDKTGRHCEIDHRISREIAGADDIGNLWPQPYGGAWGASRKDQLENALHKAVCTTHTLTLQQAQDVLRGDWTAGWVKYVGNAK